MKEARAELLSEGRKPLTSHQLGKVESKLGIVNQRLENIESRRGSFESRLNSANTRIRDTEEEIARLQTAFAQLQKAVATNTTGVPRGAVTAEHIAKAVESARSEINKAVAARDAAKSRAAAYDKSGENMVTDLWQELRYGARMLRTQKGVTIVAALSLALGIGANTALFSVVDAMLLKMPPVKEPERLVLFKTISPGI